MSNRIIVDAVIGKAEGEFSSATARQLVAQADPNKPLEIILNSEGGSVFEALACFDIFKTHPSKKIVKIESVAFSAASLLAMVGDEIVAASNAYMMLHAPYMQVEGNSKSLSENAALLAQLQDSMLKIYSEKTGTPIEAMSEILNQETYFNADQALKAGLVTSIASESVIPTRSPSTLNNLPHGVVAALFGAGSGGNKNSQPKEKPMSESKPVAATVRQIKAAFPKAKETFIVRCMEKEMPMEEVTTAMGEELQEENETLSAKVKAMEEELSAMKAAKAMEDEQVQLALAKAKAEEDEMCKAKAQQSGVKPVAKSQTPSAPASARARWTGLVSAKIQSGLSREKAILEVEKADPNIRLEMLNEVNS
jgi:ATP-dependent protease ClpP protease subunit